MRYRLQRHDGTDCSATMVPITVLRMVPIQRYRQEIYLTNRLHELERREQRKRVKNGFMGKVLRWTGTKRALVELIYALDACGCLNKGTVDIKEIVAYFEYVFDIDLGDFYHTYMELKAKTKDRTGFLSTLKDRLLMRMREQD